MRYRAPPNAHYSFTHLTLCSYTVFRSVPFRSHVRAQVHQTFRPCSATIAIRKRTTIVTITKQNCRAFWQQASVLDSQLDCCFVRNSLPPKITVGISLAKIATQVQRRAGAPAFAFAFASLGDAQAQTQAQQAFSALRCFPMNAYAR